MMVTILTPYMTFITGLTVPSNALITEAAPIGLGTQDPMNQTAN